MNKAYVTIVVGGTTCDTLLSELQDANLGDLQVVSQGDIQVTEKDLSKLTKTVWLYEAEIFQGRKLYLAEHSESTGGRVLKDDELAVLKQYGVCVEFQTVYLTGNPPLYAIHKEAAEAEVCRYGFEVPATGLKTDFATTSDGSEQRWLRIVMPAWFNP